MIMKMMKRMKACVLLLFLLTGFCYFWKEEAQVLQVMGKVAERGCAEEEKKKIALTFDDGPHPFYTEQLIRGLEEREVSATFFITGANADAHPELVKKLHEKGHLIGNHTYSHTQLNGKNEEQFKQEIIKTNEVIKAQTGEDIIYVRPPYGSWNKEFEKQLNMFPVFWTIDPLDWCSSDVNAIVKRVTTKAKENDIILMHDQYKTTVTAALKIVDQLKAEGYEFVTVEELLLD